jgi:hypothetical protein
MPRFMDIVEREFGVAFARMPVAAQNVGDGIVEAVA